MYFIPKDAPKDISLESCCNYWIHNIAIVKLTLPSKKLEIKEENIPNLKSLIMKPLKNVEETKKNGPALGN